VSGDGEFESWVREHGSSLLRFASLLCAGDAARAEDIVQSALTRLWPHWERVAVMDSPLAYAKRVVAREHISVVRRRSFGERPTPVESMPVVADAGRTVEVDAADAVWSLLRGLPPRQQAVLALQFGEDLSDRATAELLGIRASTVRSQTARALTALRRSVSPGSDSPFGEPITGARPGG
jgi:RNA polymerase sigma-70 factor, ECF subfamily